jgi:MtN3 and saliva related transmembrane protein
MGELFYTEWVGYAAGLLTTIAFLPQAIKTWRSRSAHDLSLGMFLMFCTGIILWLTYGLMLRQWPIILPNLFTLLLAGSILFFKIRSLGQ